MAYMSVEEWRKKRAGGQEGTTQSSPISTVSSTSKTSSDKTSQFMSVAEWRAERAKKSAKGWADAANALLEESQQ